MKITDVKRMESLLSYIRYLHHHHVSAPHESQEIHNGVEMIAENLAMNSVFPNTQSYNENDWKHKFDNYIYFTSQQRVYNQISVHFNNCKGYSDSDTYQDLLI